MNPAVAKGVAANVSGLAAAGIGGAAGGATGAGAALSVDANNRQLHFDEKQRITVKANGDKKAEERLTKAACYEVKCWAQFPEGSSLYQQYFVSDVEVAGLSPELAWVRGQNAAGAFVYSPFQKFTDGVAATTGLSSVNGRGTFGGEYISKPGQPRFGNPCVTAECAAGMDPFRGHDAPDYIAVQGNWYVGSGGAAVNLHNGEIVGQWSLNRSYPAYTAKPGISVNVGNIVGGADAKVTNDFLKGGGMQGNAYVPPVPAMPLVNVGGGVNHSYGGKTAVEVGVSTQPGVSVAPISYGFGGEKSGSGK